MLHLLADATNCGNLDQATCQAAQNAGTAIGATLLIFMVIGFIGYFVPTFVALVRHHPKKVSIILVNLFLGWSVVGWIVSLVWAFSSPQAPTIINNYVAPSAPPPAPLS